MDDVKGGGCSTTHITTAHKDQVARAVSTLRNHKRLKGAGSRKKINRPVKRLGKKRASKSVRVTKRI